MKTLFIILAICSISVVCATGESKPPFSRQPEKAVPVLMKLNGWPEVKEVEAILGVADREVGSGRCIFVYTLTDGSEVWANTGDCKHVDWVSLRREGKPDEVLFEAKNRPNKTSEPTAITRPPSAIIPAPLAHR